MVVDHGCSKVVIFLPCHKTIDAVGVAVLYAERIFPFYSIPRRVISDQDPHFMTQFIKGVCTLLNINQNISTAYHPQTDGQLERANQWVEQYLCIYGNSEQNDWVSLLPLAQFTHNTWVNKSMGQTPFDLLIRHTPTIRAETLDITIPEVARRKEWLEHNWLRAQAVLRNAQWLLVQWGERKKGQCHYQGFAKGDQVWLEGTNLRLSHPTAKLALKRYGPFTITNVISPVVYQLELPGHLGIHNVFHASLLMAYRETVEHRSNYVQPPSDIIEGEEEYEVERIMNSKCHGQKKKLQFLIWWKGYSPMHNSWKDATGVRAPALVEEYYQRKTAAVQIIQIDPGVRSSDTSIFPSAPSTSIVFISSISFINNGAQQRGLIDLQTSDLFALLTGTWWDDPSPWPMPNNSQDDNGGEQTLYFPGFIPKIFDKIYPTSVTPITTQPYEPDHAPAASSHIIQAAGAGPSIEIKNPVLSIDARWSRFAKEAERLPNGRFKPANQRTFGTAIPDSTPEPPEPTLSPLQGTVAWSKQSQVRVHGT